MADPYHRPALSKLSALCCVLTRLGADNVHGTGKLSALWDAPARLGADNSVGEGTL